MMLKQVVLWKPSMVKREYEKLIQRINRKDWWHVTPVDPSLTTSAASFLHLLIVKPGLGTPERHAGKGHREGPANRRREKLSAPFSAITSRSPGPT